MAVVRVEVPHPEPLPEPLEGRALNLIEIPTTRFGPLAVPPDEIYGMAEGMHGFTELRRFLLLAPESGSCFYWWQSAEFPEIAFPCIDPATIFPDYRIQADEADVLRLKLAERARLQVLVVATVPPQRPEDITVNLLGPLVMDPEHRDAWQLICERSDQRVAVPLLPLLNRLAG